MPEYVELTVTLTIQGPLLCAAPGVSAYGTDSYFQQDWKNRWILSASHVKGKLREACQELKENLQADFPADITDLFGEENNTRGRLDFSDFILQNAQPELKCYHRIRIQKESRTADEGALMTYETPFATGNDYTWKGHICYFADPNSADTIKAQVIQGLRWITTIGANKSIGFGVLRTVAVDAKRTPVSKPIISTISEISSVIGLKIEPQEPLLIGGVKRSGIFLRSDSFISGAVLKGSLAACINRRIGKSPNDPLPASIPELPILSKYFSQIRFIQALPAPEQIPLLRPVVMPLSVVQAGDQFFDVALMNGADLINDGKIPTFRIDWKDQEALDEEFGIVTPRTFTQTRAAIESESRRSKEKQLFTYLYACPEYEEYSEDNSEVSQRHSLCWLSHIFISEKINNEDGPISDEERKSLQSELEFVIQNWWDVLGKRDSHVKTTIHPGGFASRQSEEVEVLKDGLAIVSLQSDALLLKPERDNTQPLRERYNDYWMKVSENSLQLKEDRFFASQKMLGGNYLFNRFKPANNYYPYYLTEAGSVFVLEPLSGKESQAQDFLNDWKLNGLPSPAWALLQYGMKDGRLDWQRCPFTRENGFGEITVNLHWHWKKQA